MSDSHDPSTAPHGGHNDKERVLELLLSQANQRLQNLRSYRFAIVLESYRFACSLLCVLELLLSQACPRCFCSRSAALSFRRRGGGGGPGLHVPLRLLSAFGRLD